MIMESGTRSFTYSYCKINCALTINEMLKGSDIQNILENPAHFECKKLSFKCVFDPGVINTHNQKILLPKYIVCFIMPKFFDRHIVIPSSVKHLEIGDDFSENILLSKYMKYLLCNKFFVKEIKLPKYIQDVIFGERFGDETILSKNLKRVVFPGINCNQILLPKKLLVLHILKIFRNRFPTIILPKYLTEFVLGEGIRYCKHKFYLPESLHKLSCHGLIVFDTYVHGLKEISTIIYNISTTCCTYFVAELPNSMQTLNVCTQFNKNSYWFDHEHTSRHYMENIKIMKNNLKQYNCLGSFAQSQCLFIKKTINHNSYFL